MTQILLTDQNSNDGERKLFDVMNSTYKEPFFKEILIETANFAISCYLTYIYSIYCAVGMVLHINGKFTKGKLQSSHLLSFALNRRSLSISRWFNSDVDSEKC
jgi:hypothetical protein